MLKNKTPQNADSEVIMRKIEEQYKLLLEKVFQQEEWLNAHSKHADIEKYMQMYADNLRILGVIEQYLK